tara:strand:- start:1602 stop:2159 length:558 start_codon:yes stop_codon:yes gene_type:complete
MSALKPVGTGQVISTTNGSATASSAFKQQTDTLRVVAEGVGCHVAIGVNPTATTGDIYVGVSGGDEKISLGPVAAQRVIGITTGNPTTIIDFPEGTGCPFAVGDTVSLTTNGQSYYDFEHKTVASIDTTSHVGGFFSTRCTITNDSSGIVTAFAAPYAELRRSLKVSVITNASTGKAFIQQVQVS